MPTSALQVGDPQAIRRQRPEVAVHQIRADSGSRVADRGALTLPACPAGQPELAHEPLHRAAGDRRRLAGRSRFSSTTPSEPRRRRSSTHEPQRSWASGPRRAARGRSACGAVFVVGRRGDLHAELGEPGADRLDTPTQTLPVGVLVALTDVLVDIGHDQRCGRSSSAAKKADALRNIALARLSSAFSRFNRFNSAASSVVTPDRSPASISACRHHFRTVSGVPTPSSSAT